MEKANLRPVEKETTFLFEAQDAREVFLVYAADGFTIQWHPMEKDANGTWSLQLLLPQGAYEYKFYVDHQWKTDPGNQPAHTNTRGSGNSVLIVQ